MGDKKQTSYTGILSVIIILLIALIWEVYYYCTNNNVNNNVKNINTTKKSEKTVTNKVDTPKIVVISDKRCWTDCDTSWIISQLKQIPSLSKAKIKVIDYSEKEAKDILKATWVKLLPAIIFSNNSVKEVANYLKTTDNWKYSLQVGAQFDPTAEICGNWIDDDKNWKTDCEDSACSKTLACAPKVDKPKAELFVMSYCPFWTQAEKWYLDVIKKLWKVADVKIKYVNYIMHWEKEGEQNIVQNCIQSEQNDKFVNYMSCFLKEGKNEECLKTAKIDTNKLNSCIEKTKKDIQYTQNLKNKVWNFPKFLLDDSENNKYGVQGSPTFVLNGIKIDRVWRSAKAYADLICNSFKKKPKECEQNFSTTTYDPQFWFTSNWKAVAWGGCGK